MFSAISPSDLSAIWLTIKLAGLVTLILMIVGLPLAWWLSQTQSRWRAPVSALIALPLVLPPSVLGFYLLLAMGKGGPLGQLTELFGLGTLAFSFWGLVIGSLLYSMPFVIQPLQNAMQAIGSRPLEVAKTLGASPLDCFFSIVLPSIKPGLLTAAILGFAHTVGEFGLVLMIGGNIPGETQVVSVQIYEHVEALDYSRAHALSALMLIFAFVVLVLVYRFNEHASSLPLDRSRSKILSR